MNSSMKLYVMATLAALANAEVITWGQCGGLGYTGQTTCKSVDTCTEINPYYSQCIPSTKPSIPTSVQVTSTSTTPGQGLPTCFGTLTYYPYTTTVQTTYTFTRTIGPPVAPRAADLEPRYSPPACTTTSVTAPYTQYSYAYSETDIYTYIPPFTRTPTPTPTPTPF